MVETTIERQMEKDSRNVLKTREKKGENRAFVANCEESVEDSKNESSLSSELGDHNITKSRTPGKSEVESVGNADTKISGILEEQDMYK